MVNGRYCGIHDEKNWQRFKEGFIFLAGLACGILPFVLVFLLSR